MNAPSSIAPYDVEAVRRDFPILAKTVYGKPLVYLDNGASAQKPRAVLERMMHAYTEEYANVHRGLHYLSNAATEAYEEAREIARDFLNAVSTEEIVFTRSSTEAINLVAASYGGLVLKPGDEVILSILEHHSNIVPWNFHRERNGVVIKWAPVHEDGAFDLEAFKALLTERTRIVAITHMSNVTGTIVPLTEVVRLAHEAGAVVMVDGSQGAVHLPVDVRALGADFYVFTGHKVYGPTGIGVLWGRKALLDAMPPWQGGGEMIREVTEDGVTYNDPPHRFEAGTPPIVQAIGLGAALRYMQALGRDRILAHENDLRDYAMQRLGALNSVRIFGTTPEKGSIVAFEMKGAHAHDVATIIDRSGVAVRAGTHCAMPLLARYGVTSTCRASFGLYNTRGEVDKLVEALQKAETLFG
jgi:cysteine desulfurase / selenocysteine lyase